MQTTRMITIRVPDADFELLEREAALHERPLSTFARERLLAHVRWNADLQQLRQEVLQALAGEHSTSPGADPAHPSAATTPLLLEALLLLRRAAAPQVLAQVHGELTRRGVAAYQPEEP